jgi:hypothetical protein
MAILTATTDRCAPILILPTLRWPHGRDENGGPLEFSAVEVSRFIAPFSRAEGIAVVYREQRQFTAQPIELKQVGGEPRYYSAEGGYYRKLAVSRLKFYKLAC